MGDQTVLPSDMRTPAALVVRQAIRDSILLIEPSARSTIFLHESCPSIHPTVKAPLVWPSATLQASSAIEPGLYGRSLRCRAAGGMKKLLRVSSG
jgi:hypothetical protein